MGSSDRVWGVSFVLERGQLCLQNCPTKDHVVVILLFAIHQVTRSDNLIVFKKTFREILLEGLIAILRRCKTSKGHLEGAHPCWLLG